MKQAWVVTVDMGYGHQRAADPFRDIAHERIITANTDEVVHEKERRQWRQFQEGYEGGAGVQSHVAVEILHSSAPFIKKKRLRLNLIAGVRKEVAAFFREAIHAEGLDDELGSGVRVLLAPDKGSYFREFNVWLRDTDILWTKPSELVFYAALGIPVLMTPPLGSHEVFNRDWLQIMGAGYMQEHPRHAGEWLVEWAQKGVLAEAAYNGYAKAPRFGTQNVKTLMFASDRDSVQLLR